MDQSEVERIAAEVEAEVREQCELAEVGAAVALNAIRRMRAQLVLTDDRIPMAQRQAIASRLLAGAEELSTRLNE